MRMLALHFPRLGVQIAKSAEPRLRGLPVALVSGEGDHGLVAVASAEAGAAGVLAGMSIEAARGRAPRLVVRRDEAGGDLDLLDSVAAIIARRATPLVAIVSRETIVVNLRGLDRRFAGEAHAAEAIARLVRDWSGLDVRAGVAGTVEVAAQIARGPGRCLTAAPDDGTVGSLPAPREGLSARAHWDGARDAAVVEAKLVRGLTTLETVMANLPSSYRQVSLALDAEGGRRQWTVPAARPFHTAAEAFDLLQARVPAPAMARASGFEVRLERPGPDVRVAPWRHPQVAARPAAATEAAVSRQLALAS